MSSLKRAGLAMTNYMYDIITIGSATRDVFLTSKALHPHRRADVVAQVEACFPFGAKINVENIHFDTGGGATNNATTFARLGKFRTAAVTRIGDDSAGRDILEVLKREHVDTSFVQMTKEDLTAYSTIIAGQAGERTILVYRGASRAIEHSLPWSRLRARWFHLSSLGGDFVLLQKILAHAKKIGAKVAFNPGGQELRVIASPVWIPISSGSYGVNSAKQSRSLLSQTTFLILNREEAATLTGAPFGNVKKLLRALMRLAPAAVMTDGPKGAYAVTSLPLTAYRLPPTKRPAISHEQYAYFVPSVGHKAKSRTGAGDAFGSGFVTGWIKSRGGIEEALRVGAVNADSVVQKVGAKVGILNTYPSKSKLRKLSVKLL